MEDAALVPAHFRHLATEDLVSRRPEQWAAVVASQVDAARQRARGESVVRLLVDGAAAGAPPGTSVLEVVTDDMPFLVDSLIMAAARLGLGTQLVVHPRLQVERDSAGRLLRARGLEETWTGAELTGVEDGPTVVGESWSRLELDGVTDEMGQRLVGVVRDVLADVRAAVVHWPAMQARLLEVAADLTDPVAADLLRWVADDHFTFLGAADLEVDPDGEARMIPGTGLGIFADFLGRELPEAEPVQGRPDRTLVVDKAIDRSTVHRPGNLDRLTIRTFGDDGRVVSERRFLGLWSTRARSESVMRIPGLQVTVAEVLELAGVEPTEHAGKAVLHALETYPRDELFAADPESLLPVALNAAAGGETRRLSAFVRRDLRGRYVSVLVNLPRDQYSTVVRERIAAILREQFAGERLEFGAHLDESRSAQVHFVVHPPEGQALAEPDEEDVEALLARAARSWRDDLLAAAVDLRGPEAGPELVRRWAAGLPESYKEVTSAAEAVEDLGVLSGLQAGEVAMRMVVTHLHSDRLTGRRRVARLKVCRSGIPVSLADMLPLLHSAGVEVLDERPHEVTGPDGKAWIYDFEMSHPTEVPYASPEIFVDAVHAMWDDRCEVDGLNALVLVAGLTWRQVVVLRAIASYLRQGGLPYRLESTVAALRANASVTRLLAELFEVRFDPDRFEDEAARAEAEARVAGELAAELDAVERRDHDRILRAHLSVLDATLRTNHFRTDAVGDASTSGPEGSPRPHLALKLAPRRIPGLPEPRPEFEVFVHSPRVEGLHLRFGAVARGGLRWSDRSDDFRTEVLGLVKAQMVKNSVIVPVGAKGGFVARQLPDPRDREAWLEEGIACYRAFVSCLLDVTDNLVEGTVVPPPRVVRRDAADHYLVVAADKGTAAFSDIANALSADYEFWLGDAFASGGSVGYDHKRMGITARGAWVSVQRHFRERGVDVQSVPFTCVGIGDMSGDVFGNGLLCSPATKLVAAFDHRDVFLDPDPDPRTSFVERQRLFDTSRSSWQDYDRALISEGGGVHSRSAKTIPVSPQVRHALGMADEVEQVTPEELIRAVLTAPVDLLWNGGIGTYVKASYETHADVGDPANDAIRVDGRDLRARAVGEGGNLGFTQAGRVELARTARPRGSDPDDRASRGAVNTDFIDNSAGVDTSDHEVNIKILLDAVVASDGIDVGQRNQLLAAMTDEVATLVLRDNYHQNLALADEAAAAVEALHVHEQWMRELEARGVLDRALESLPNRTDVRRRRETGEGLTVPELSVLLSWTKIVMAEELLASAVPDEGYLRGELIGYFSSALRQDRRGEMVAHPLRREIVTTQVVNSVVNEAGVTAWSRTAEETGEGAPQFALAHLVAGELFGCAALREGIAGLDHQVDAAVQTRMRAEVRTLQRRAVRWLLARTGGSGVDAEAVVDAFSVPVQRLLVGLPRLISGTAADAASTRRREWVDAGVPTDLAGSVAVLPEAAALLAVVHTASLAGAAPDEVLAVHLTLGQRLRLHQVRDAVESLPRGNRWNMKARSALAVDLERAHAGLDAVVVGSTRGGIPGIPAAEERVEAWATTVGDRLGRTEDLLDDVVAEGPMDLARASVAVRAVRALLERD